MSLRDASDARLIDDARKGDQGSFSELWRRYWPLARSIASRSTKSMDPEDLAQEAFVHIWSAMQRGKGPIGVFKPYLSQTVRNLAISAARRKASIPMGDANDLDAHQRDANDDPSGAVIDRSMVAEAFASLPEQWRRVLWLTIIEGHAPRDAAPALGLSPNATSALAMRAREGLRQAWLATHMGAGSHDQECLKCREVLPAFARGKTTPTQSAAVRLHLAMCEECTRAYEELKEPASLMRGVVPITVLSSAARTAPSPQERSHREASHIKSHSWLRIACAGAVFTSLAGLAAVSSRVDEVIHTDVAPLSEVVEPAYFALPFLSTTDLRQLSAFDVSSPSDSHDTSRPQSVAPINWQENLALEVTPSSPTLADSMGSGRSLLIEVLGTPGSTVNVMLDGRAFTHRLKDPALRLVQAGLAPGTHTAQVQYVDPGSGATGPWISTTIDFP